MISVTSQIDQEVTEINTVQCTVIQYYMISVTQQGDREVTEIR